jgi:hypothetical protein
MAKNVLKCSYQNHWNHFPILQLPINDIWQSLPSVDVLPSNKKLPFKKTLIEDIARDGMHFPIMVVNSTYTQLMDAKKKWGNKVNELPFWHNEVRTDVKYQWSVWGGSQRLDVAKHLGYSHIDCAEIPSIAQAVKLQNEMRKPFIERYY